MSINPTLTKFTTARPCLGATVDCRWGKHGSSWCLCQDAGGARRYWLTLICFVSMVRCVSIGSQGPGISPAVLGLAPQLGLNPADIMMLWPLLTQTYAITLSLIMCQASTLIKPRFNPVAVQTCKWRHCTLNAKKMTDISPWVYGAKAHLAFW